MKNKFVYVCAIALSMVLVVSLSSCGKDSDEKSSSKNKSEAASDVKIKDEQGYYDYKSDDSVTKPPKKGIIVGDGREVEITYDHSKGDILSYQLYFINTDGAVIAMGGGTFDEDKDGDNLYVGKIKTFTSNADGKNGFMEITTVTEGEGDSIQEAMANSKNVTLGMYPVKFKISK